MVKTLKAARFRSQFDQGDIELRRSTYSSRPTSSSAPRSNGSVRQVRKTENENLLTVETEVRVESQHPKTVKTTSGSTSQSPNNNLVQVLIGISVLFILCQSFKIIPDLYEMIFCRRDDPETGGPARCDVPAPVTFIVKISHLLVCCNSACNFLFYFFHGAKFRKAFKETFLFQNCCPDMCK